MNKLIGLTGKAGCGKSTVADMLRGHGYQIESLADPIKRIVQDLFGASAGQLWGPSERRNEEIAGWPGVTARKACQILGTEGGRAIHPDVWVRACLKRANDTLRCVIPDVRFENEAAAVRAAGGVVIHVHRSGAGLRGVYGLHSSEVGVSLEPEDVVLYNNGTLEDLAATVAEMMR